MSKQLDKRMKSEVLNLEKKRTKLFTGDIYVYLENLQKPTILNNER